jgi:hypothetical protein
MEKLNMVEGKDQCHAEFSNKFRAIENLEAVLNANSASEARGKNVKLSAKENLDYQGMKKRKPWFSEGCSELSYHRKRAKLQWMYEPSEINEDNLNSVET